MGLIVLLKDYLAWKVKCVLEMKNVEKCKCLTIFCYQKN